MSKFDLGEFSVDNSLILELKKVLAELFSDFTGSAPREDLVDECVFALVRYTGSLLEVNKEINLTAIRDLNEAIVLHLLDSLAVVSVLPKGLVLDWGSGGGFPGVPIFLVRKLLFGDHSNGVICMDARRKKVNAISEICCRADVPAVGLKWGRGEEVVETLRPLAVVMRAVAPEERILSWLVPVVRDWIVFASEKQLNNWKTLEPALIRKGFRIGETKEYRLIGRSEARYIVSLQRSS